MAGAGGLRGAAVPHLFWALTLGWIWGKWASLHLALDQGDPHSPLSLKSKGSPLGLL